MTDNEEERRRRELRDALTRIQTAVICAERQGASNVADLRAELETTLTIIRQRFGPNSEIEKRAIRKSDFEIDRRCPRPTPPRDPGQEGP